MLKRTAGQMEEGCPYSVSRCCYWEVALNQGGYSRGVSLCQRASPCPSPWTRGLRGGTEMWVTGALLGDKRGRQSRLSESFFTSNAKGFHPKYDETLTRGTVTLKLYVHSGQDNPYNLILWGAITLIRFFMEHKTSRRCWPELVRKLQSSVWLYNQ